MANSLETAALLLKETLAIQKRSIKTAAQLLEKTSDIRKECEKRYRETGETYNVFKVASISEKEIWMCNVLVDLLNPKGSHYRGSVYLEYFKDMVVKLPHLEKAENLDISKAEVKKQSLTEDRKLIDIVISDRKIYIFIEAKINTDDSPEQLSNYAKQSDRMNKTFGFIPVLFLTKDGHGSTKEVPRERYEPISFKKHIISWLEACLEFEKTNKAPPIEDTKNVLHVREVNISQYIKAIKSFCGIMEDEAMEKEKIHELIMSSYDKYEAALQISKVVNELDGKVKELFKTQILNLVKKEFPQTEPYTEKRTNGRSWLIINLKNCFDLSVTSDVKTFVVQKTNLNLKIDVKKRKEINEKMSSMLHDELDEKENKNWEEEYGGIWACTNARNLDIDEENDDKYKYKLYRTYKNKPQSVADWIVSIAKELEEIKTAAKHGT